MRLISSLLLCLIPAALAEVPGEWPRWRGPFDTGVARGDAPLKWSDTENIAWKIQPPGKGNSSPVVWGDKLFLTSAVPNQAGAGQTPEAPAAGGGRRGGFGQGASGEQPEHKLTVLCYDRKSGKLLWERVVKSVKPHEGYHQRYGSFASNTPVTDGKRLYVSFGSHGAFALDLEGKQLWSWESGIQMRMRNAFGEGVAPTLHEDTLLLLFDHEGEDFLQALDAATGKPKWRVARTDISNWAAPLVVEHGGSKQVVVSAPTKVRSYDFKTGELIWEAAGLGANTIPTPVQFKDTVIVMSGFRDPNLLTIKLGRKGDLTGTDAILWTTNRGTSYTPSPVLHEGRLYMLTDNGMLSCLDAATGKAFYERTRLPKPYNFKSSPVLVKDRLYMASENGDVIVVKAGETFEVLATNTLADHSFIATPAVAGGHMYLRSETHLFSIRP